MSAWDTMIAELAELPVLSGARCKGNADVFDAAVTDTRGRPPQAVEQARQDATQLCSECPALRPCAEWLNTLPVDHRPIGVVAGQVITPSGLSLFQRERAERAQKIAQLHATGMSVGDIANTIGISKSGVRHALTERTG